MHVNHGQRPLETEVIRVMEQIFLHVSSKNVQNLFPHRDILVSYAG